MQLRNAIAVALVLLLQCVEPTDAGSYGKTTDDADWDSEPITVTSTSNDDIKQSYNGPSAPVAAPVVAVPTAVNANDGDDDDDDDDTKPVATPAATPASVYESTTDDNDSEDAPVVTPAPTTTAPIVESSSDDNDDGDDDDSVATLAPTTVALNYESSDDDNDDDDDDGDDSVNSYTTTETTTYAKPYEQTDSYGKSTGGNNSPQQQQQQTDTTNSGDSKPNVHNGGVNLYPYTQEIRDYIVETHNWARGALVPTQAANMRQLKWDESLAIEASELVNTCVFEHDTENYAYGQNLMYGGYSLDKAMVSGWMDGWVKNELSSYDRSGTGFMDLDHASAVLWANSYLVGCASKMCANGYLTACNYYTPGNWQGERAYIPGPSCSQCPSQAPYCDATGRLCTADPSGSATSSLSPVVTPAPTTTKTPVPVVSPAKTAPATAAPTPQTNPAAQITPPAGGKATTPAYGPKATPAPTQPFSGKVSPYNGQKATPAPTIPHELFCV
ncbi:Peptidase inhibitor 16 isoform x3, partial [Globisporangium splendens]